MALLQPDGDVTFEHQPHEELVSNVIEVKGEIDEQVSGALQNVASSTAATALSSISIYMYINNITCTCHVHVCTDVQNIHVASMEATV